MTEFEQLSVIADFGLLLASIAAVIIAGIKLGSISSSSKTSARANQNANIMAVLSLEKSLADARYNIVKATHRVSELDDSSDSKALEFAELLFNEAKEQYLNVADRLSACIIRGQVDEDVYRRDYRSWVNDIMSSYPEELGANTRHPNIVKVYQAWNDDISAVDSSILTPS